MFSLWVPKESGRESQSPHDASGRTNSLTGDT